MDIRDIKNRLYESHERFIVAGHTHTGKSELLRYLMPKKFILHTDCDIKSGQKSILSLSNLELHPVIGIDEVHYVDNRSITDCIRYVRHYRKGLVIVCQTTDDLQPNLEYQLHEATVINTNQVDLRELLHEYSPAPTLKLVQI